MKICFPYRIADDVGGPSTFVRNFCKFADTKGLEITHITKEKCDILFIIVSASQELCERKKREGTKIVLRLDGIYHDLATDFERYNLPIKRTLEYADFIIFQSEFCRKFVERYFGEIEKPHTIIYNGVDEEMFNQSGPQTDLPFKVNLFTLDAWRPTKRLHEAIRIMKAIDDSEIGLVVGGGFLVEEGDTPIKQHGYFDKIDLSSPKIQWIDHINWEELPTYYRSAALFLCCSYRNPCPNTVLEAMSCGLPVVAEWTGGIPEILGDGGIIVDPIKEDDFSPKDFSNLEDIPKLDVSSFIDAIKEILNNREHYSNLARKRAEELSLEKMGEKYLAVFKSLIR